MEKFTAVRELIGSLEHELLTLDEDTVHDLVFEKMLNEALERHGPATLRKAALELLIAVACHLHRNDEIQPAQLGSPLHPDPDIAHSHAAAIEAAQAVAPVGQRPTAVALSLLTAAADRHGWDAWVLFMAASRLANTLSVLEDPQLDAIDRGWVERFVAELRTEFTETAR